MPVLMPPRLEAIIKERLGRCEPEPQRVPWVTESIAASPNGFISLRTGTQRRITPRNAHQDAIDPTEVPYLLPPESIARELGRYQRDPQFRGDRRIPLRALARVARVGKNTIYQAAQGKRICNRSRLRLSLAIRAITRGELRFRRQGKGVRWERVLQPVGKHSH